MAFDPERISNKLCGYPAEVVDSFTAFAREGDFQAFDAGLLGALGFLSETSDADTARNAPDEARLREDLNIDSLAMTELVFLVEDNFGASIVDEELEVLHTVSDLKRLARQKLSTKLV